MGYWIKIGDTWNLVLTSYKKDLSIWDEINQANLTQYLNTNLSFYVGEISGDHTLSIGGLTEISGVSCSYVAVYDNRYDVTSAATWAIVSGSEYATMDSGGVVTILQTATGSPVTISATYQNITQTANLTLTYNTESSSHTETEVIVDESGNTEIITTTTTENEDGSTTENTTSVTLDESGNTVGTTETEINTNSDGSFSGTSTSYDSQGIPIDGYNTTGDTSGNVNTQGIEYDENGNSAVTSYVIDTSDNPDGSKTYNGDGVNTEYYAFDVTRGFILDYHFTIDCSNSPSGQDENHHNALTAKRANPSPWYGFQLRQSTTNKYIQLGTQFSTGGNTNTKLNPNSITGNTAEYNLQIIYDPTAATDSFICKNRDTGTVLYRSNGKFPDIEELRYLKVTLGYAMDPNGDPFRYANIDVKEFSIRRLPVVLVPPVVACNNNEITLTCETVGARIYYRLNQTGSYVLYTSPISISADTVIETYSMVDGERSATVTETCEYDSNIATPVILCDGQQVSISCDTVGADIYYRLNQEGSFTQYSTAIPISADTIVEAYAELDGDRSDTATETCHYNPEHDYAMDYLTFQVISGGTINWNLIGSGTPKTIQYSINDGEWTSITSSTATTISVAAGDTVRLKGNNSTYATSNTDYSGFGNSTAIFDVEGNIMSLCYGDNFQNQTALVGTYNFCSMFKLTNVISAENLILPAMTLTPHCYRALFANSPSLEVAPALPATTLAEACYRYMFQECSITTAPDLPAQTLAVQSYNGMFVSCSNLNYIRCLATDMSATDCTTSWTNGVASRGTFVKDANTEWVTGINGIPKNWTIVNEGIQVPTIECDGLLVTILCGTSGASIYYRENEQGDYGLYSSAFSITADTIVQAYSVFSGESSSTVSATCIYDDGLEEPVIYCDGEHVTISCDTGGASIFYRLDQAGNYIQYDYAIPISADTIVQSYSEIDGRQSAIVSANCIYDASLKAPVVNCDGQHIELTCTTVGADIYYRLNQEGNYDQYASAITISADTVVQAYSVRDAESSITITEMCIYDPTHHYENDYLTLRALTTGTIAWKSVGSGQAKTIQYSVNDGAWTPLTASSSSVINVTAGDAVRIKGSNTAYAKDKSNYSGFEGGTAYYDVEGNIMSLCYGDNFSEQTTLPGTYTFCSLFKLSNATSAKNLVLPAPTLTEGCYRAMFSKASSLVEAPAIIPAQTLAKDCCWYMFEECPFETAPELPAPTLVQTCYGWMFVNCHNLNYIKCLAVTGFSSSNCLQSWVTGVSSTGIFVKDENAATGSTGWKVNNVAGIPVGWTLINDGEDTIADPEIFCDGEEITITCKTSGASIYYKLNHDVSYSTYSTEIPISADTFVEAYSDNGEIQSDVISANCIYYVESPYSASNKNLVNWTYNGVPLQAPNSVNAQDGHSSSYAKGTFNYETTVSLKKTQPTYLWFQHADQSATIYVDNTLVEKHWGGYTAFFVDISSYAHKGVNNIKVALKNNEGNNLAPAAGDFNFNATLGNVKLFSSPYLPAMNYGYDGFHVTSEVSSSSAIINVTTNIPTGATVVCTIDDGTYHYSDSGDSTGNEMIFSTTINNPHLWNGKADPHLYNITLEIYHDNELYHKYERPYGLRYYSYVINDTNVLGNGDPYTGFLLNGSPYLLRGCCMHDDIDGKANALSDADYTQTFNVIQELGCNFLRLAHYPHPKEVYDWCDRLGIIVQTEGPCVNKMQSTMPSDYYDHLNGQYDDMVNQHYNHPCILFWGLSNETTTDDKAFANTKINGYISRIKALDAERWVGYVMAAGAPDPSAYYNNPNADWFGCNIYEGWYNNPDSNNPSSQINTRIRNIITNKQKALAYSEYGCGGTQHCHSDDFLTTTTRGNNPRHDIEYQMWLHEGHIAAIKNYPELLFTAQWQLFDIAVANRNEGYIVCLDGENTSTDDSLRRLNNKGLVERDHVTKKDTFYLYKAWWNPTPFVHICGKDYTKTSGRVIKCYTNDGNNASLYVNNTFVETVGVTNNIASFSSTNFSSGDVVLVSGSTTSDTFTFE